MHASPENLIKIGSEHTEIIDCIKFIKKEREETSTEYSRRGNVMLKSALCRYHPHFSYTAR